MYAKKIPFLFGGSLSWRKGQAKLFALMVACMLCSINPSVNAAVKTHQWMENHRGYTIEYRGTTAGGTDEYVAAGTVFDKGGTGLHGWHFMRLDQNGNILASRIAWVPGGDNNLSFRVVDIERQSSDKFWIVIQVRDETSGSENDYIYIAGVDASGNDLAVNPTTVIKSAERDHTNVYATNALYQHGYLYICGYTAEGTQYPNEPTNTTSDKYGMMLTCDMSANPATIANNYTWNSTGAGNTDFDMALHISLPNNNVPILVTGAVNSGDEYLSAIHAGTFHTWGSPIATNALVPTVYAVGLADPRVNGVYGVDMKGTFNIANNDENEGYAILVNYFDEQDLTKKTWGILRVKTDLTAYAYPNQSFIGINDAKSWANNFLTVHYDDPNTTWADVLGQQIDIYGVGDEGNPCGVNIAAPNKNPSLFNVNPFMASVAVDGANWDYTNGYSLSSGYFKPNTLHLSSVGTTSAAMDYYTGSTSPGSALEDISRLYNFGHALPKYSYASTPSSLRFPPTLIVPVGVDSNIAVTQTPYLKTKMIRANAAFQETSCNNYTQDCIDQFTSSALDVSPGYAVSYDYIIDNTTFSLTNATTIPTATDCSTGLYKQTAVNNTVAAKREIKIYPNPATDNLNIVLPGQTGDKGQMNFVLTDITGKVVYSIKADDASGKTITVHLPGLAQGMYIARAELNGTTHIEKVVIQ